MGHLVQHQLVAAKCCPFLLYAKQVGPVNVISVMLHAGVLAHSFSTDKEENFRGDAHSLMLGGDAFATALLTNWQGVARLWDRHPSLAKEAIWSQCYQLGTFYEH